MANPVAAHTFDFTRIYLSTRDNAAPGAGVWGVNTTIFDGSGDDSEAVTFSAGALDSMDARGIVCNSKTNKLTFLGDGIPTAPILINITGEGNVGSSDFWDVTQGAFKHGSDYYLAYFSSTGGLKIAKSSDNGATWIKKDEGHGPSAITVAIDATIQRVDNKICVSTWQDDGETDIAIWEFDMATDLWSAVIAHVASNLTRFALNYRWTNALFKFVNGDYLVVYLTNTFAPPFGVYPVARLWTASGNSWGPELVLPGRDFAQAVMDPDLNIVHLMTYETASKDAVIHYSEFNHNTNTLTTDITTFVNGASSDGAGHSSIQNGKLFVPLDAAADFANAVYVAAIPVVSFSKELLPVPAGESAIISSSTLNAGGAGYAANDTGTINGGAAGFLATYKINTVAAGVVTGYSITASGGGYSVAGGVATTPGGAQPGGGAGFKINITGTDGKIPTCAYMMFPNGYNLNPGPITLDFDLIGSPSGTGLARVNPDSPAPGPILTPTECVNQQ